MPTSASLDFNEDAIVPAYEPPLAGTRSVRLFPSLTYPKGCLLGQVTISLGTFRPYDNGGSDGRETALCILKFACSTDSSGRITYGDVSTGGEVGEKHETAPAFVKGAFFTADLPQAGTGAIDAAAVTDLGRLSSGNLADGVLEVR